MPKSILFLAALFMACLGATPVAQAQTPGDWVLARFRNGNYWYPGVVQGIGGGRITVQYDDGDRETLPVGLVRPYDWTIGSRVQCNFRGAGSWYPGRITALGGSSLSIAYDDGDRERTGTGRCRSN